MFDLNKILGQAVEKNVTDIHLIPKSKPMYRIGTSLVKMECSDVLEYNDMDKLYKYFNRENSNNKCNANYEINGINVNVNISFSNQVPIYTMKILKNELKEYTELQLPEILRKMTCRNQGIILVAGNKKSGKTTTLNSLVRCINETQNKKIITLEKNIEYTHIPRNSIIIQKWSGKDFKSYSEGVKNALNEDCDVLVVEDVRDKDTFEAILEFVEKGHLVIAGINSDSIDDSIEKIKTLYNKDEQDKIAYDFKKYMKIIVHQKIFIGKNGEKEMLSYVKSFENEDDSISLAEAISRLYVDDKITLKQAHSEIAKDRIDELNNIIMMMKIHDSSRKKGII